MRVKVVGAIALLLILDLLFIGCGDEATLPTSSSLTDAQLTLIVSRNENGQMLIKSPEAKLYDFDFLEKVLDDEVPGAKIALEQPPSEENSVQLGPPQDPGAKPYIVGVYPWSSRNGVSLSLTWEGFSIGRYWDGAWALSYWTISEYEGQSGSAWPYYKRSRESIANEILFHCWLIYTPLWERAFPIDMGFSETMWD